jgi:hypothetical protein
MAPGEASVTLELDPTAISVATGATFTLHVAISGAKDVHSVPFRVTYDKERLGTVEITPSRPPESEGISGRGVVITLTFQAKTTGRFPVKITKAAIVHNDHQTSAASGWEITVSVQ